MITPIFLIPPLAFLMLLYRVYRFWESKYTNFIQLGLGIVDIYFIIIYMWIISNPLPSIEKAEAVRAGVLLLFFLNVLYKTIELFGLKIYKFTSKFISNIKFTWENFRRNM